MSKKIIYLILAISIGLNAGMIATTLVHRKSGPPPGPGPRPGEGPGHRPDPQQMVDDHVRGITRHLELDPAQQQAIREVMELHAPELVLFQMEVRETGKRLADAFRAPTFDAERFRQLTAQASTARSRLDSLSAVMLVEEAAVLTPEQRKRFAEVAPSIHNNPQPPPREGGPPPR